MQGGAAGSAGEQGRGQNSQPAAQTLTKGHDPGAVHPEKGDGSLADRQGIPVSLTEIGGRWVFLPVLPERHGLRSHHAIAQSQKSGHMMPAPDGAVQVMVQEHQRVLPVQTGPDAPGFQGPTPVGDGQNFINALRIAEGEGLCRHLGAAVLQNGFPMPAAGGVQGGGSLISTQKRLLLRDGHRTASFPVKKSSSISSNS